jgi:hypothetical protein
MNQNVVSDVYLLIAIEVIDCIGRISSSHYNGSNQGHLSYGWSSEFII